MIPSYNIRETIIFFRDLLDFTIPGEETNYAIIYKDSYTIHVLPAGEDIGEMEFYIEVDDIEKVWDLIKDKVGKMKVKAPFDREYGMREIHIIIPQTKTLLFIGQSIKHRP